MSHTEVKRLLSKRNFSRSKLRQTSWIVLIVEDGSKAYSPGFGHIFLDMFHDDSCSDLYMG